MIIEVNPNEAPYSILCADFWPRKSLDKLHMDAYKKVENDGIIRVKRVIFIKKLDRVVVEYMSQIPAEWVKDHLRKALVKPASRQLKLNV